MIPLMMKKDIPLKDLKLNLNHCRHVPRRDEESVLKTMVESGRDRFITLYRGLIRNGYLPVETLLVMVDENENYTVMDGNRRVAALKYAHGLLQGIGLALQVVSRSA